MRRTMLFLTVALIMAAMMLAMAMPAFANKGGTPHAGSCGLGRDVAHSTQQNPTLPGASEAGTFNFFCEGGN